jgi:hypothetical protein
MIREVVSIVSDGSDVSEKCVTHAIIIISFVGGRGQLCFPTTSLRLSMRYPVTQIFATLRLIN